MFAWGGNTGGVGRNLDPSLGSDKCVHVYRLHENDLDRVDPSVRVIYLDMGGFVESLRFLALTFGPLE